MDRRKRNEMIAHVLLWASGFLALAILIWVLVYIFVGGIPVISWQFLTEWPAGWGHTGGGIYPTIIATIQVTAIALLIATPLSVGGAIYLTEYTKESLIRKVIRQGAEILAGIPSIILGLFGFLFFVIALKQYTGGWSILSGGLTLAFMIIPITLRVSEEALKTVPLKLREGGLGLGATKWQMITTLVLPTALPGIITGIILGMGRALGETAALLLTVGGAVNIATSLQDPARPMTMNLYEVLTEYRDTSSAYGTSVILVVAILLITFATDMLMNRYIRNLKGL